MVQNPRVDSSDYGDQVNVSSNMLFWFNGYRTKDFAIYTDTYLLSPDCLGVEQCMDRCYYLSS